MPHLLSVRAIFLLPSILDFYKRITQPNPDDRPNILGVMIRFKISRILFVPWNFGCEWCPFSSFTSSLFLTFLLSFYFRRYARFTHFKERFAKR